MTTYEVRNPYDVRPIDQRRAEYKYIGEVIVRPATEAERAQFAPLHAALERQRALCLEAHWEHKLAQRKAVGQ